MERYGCYYDPPNATRKYLTQVNLDVHTTILSSSSRTVLTQTFVNPSSTETLPEVSYAFPLYDGVSVADFTCHVRDTVIRGVVKPREDATQIYEEAKSKGLTAAVMHQSLSASDAFTTRVGNVPAGGTVRIEITVLGELKQDAQTDGLRYTLPNKISPRYGMRSDDIALGSSAVQSKTAIRVDVHMEKGLVIRSIQSPSHPIKVDLGRTSTMAESTFEPCYASAALGVGGDGVVIEEDFVLTVNADKADTPCALLETHPTIPNQRALMVSLVPKFGLPPASPEIVFVIDRSGSMVDKMTTLKSALKVFLKSLPLGVHFNIISFGSNHSSLWSRSQAYDKNSLAKALKFTDKIEADMGGTEILGPLVAAVENRYKDKELEVLLLTDGEVWNQQSIFDFVTKTASESTARFFSLGIGNSASHALIEGMARAGRGFAQSVINYEDLDKKVIRMLKGALTPHVDDYTLDLHVPPIEEEDYEVVEAVESDKEKSPASISETATLESSSPRPPAQTISLFDSEYKEPDETPKEGAAESLPLPKINIPAAIQSPTTIPPLYPFIRTTVYVLFSSKAGPPPDKITLRATSKQGPLSLDIPVVDVGKGETIHQLAAKKAMLDLEEGRGWVRQAKEHDGTLIVDKYESRTEELVKRECERLGTSFRVAGRHCSFVAVDTRDPESSQTTELTLDQRNAAYAKHLDTYDLDLDVADASMAYPSVAAQMQMPLGSSSVVNRIAPKIDSLTRSIARAPPPPPTRSMRPARSLRRGFGSLETSSPPLPPPPPAPLRRSRVDDSVRSSPFSASPPPCPPPSGGLVMGTAIKHKKRVWSGAGLFASRGGGSRDPLYDNEIGTRGSSGRPKDAPSRHRMEFTDETDEEMEDSPAPGAEDSTADGVYGLIVLQTFDGPWEWSEALFQALGLDMAKTASALQAIYESVSGEGDAAAVVEKEPRKTIFATSLVTVYLEQKAAESKDVWELVKAKADDWVKSALEGLGERDRETMNKVIARLGELL